MKAKGDQKVPQLQDLVERRDAAAHCQEQRKGVDLGVRLAQFFLLAPRYDDIADGDGRTGAGGVGEAQALDLVGQFGGFGPAILFKALANHLFEVLFFHGVVLKAQTLGQSLVKDDASHGCCYYFAVGRHRPGRGWLVAHAHIAQAYFNQRLKVNDAVMEGQ